MTDADYIHDYIIPDEYEGLMNIVGDENDT